MTKFKTYILTALLACLVLIGCKNPEQYDTTETVEVETVDEDIVVVDTSDTDDIIETETVADSIYVAESNHRHAIRLENELASKEPYTLDTDTTLVHKKFAAQFKNKYLNDESFDYEQKLEKSSWDIFKEWLNDLIDSFFSQFRTSNSTIKNLDLILKIGGYVVIVFVVYLLVRAYMQNDLYWFVKRKSKKTSNIDVDDIELNLETIDFKQLVGKTEQSDNYRLAVRYYYLWLLQRLQEQGHIKWHIEKTNSDYINEIADTTIKATFEYLSYIYNNIWYGEQPINKEEYTLAKQSFDNTLKYKRNE